MFELRESTIFSVGPLNRGSDHRFRPGAWLGIKQIISSLQMSRDEDPRTIARRSASVALLGTLRPLMASLFQCLEYDDEVRVGLAHGLSQALPLFRGQGWDGSVNTAQRRGNIVDIAQ